jgi:hypothetical protein
MSEGFVAAEFWSLLHAFEGMAPEKPKEVYQ